MHSALTMGYTFQLHVRHPSDSIMVVSFGHRDDPKVRSKVLVVKAETCVLNTFQDSLREQKSDRSC